MISLKARVTIFMILTVSTVFSQKAEIRSWGLNYGFEFSGNKDISTMRTNFPDARYIQNDFTTHHHDSTISHTGVFPFVFEGNISIGFNTVDDNWLSRVELRPMLGVYHRELGYDNRVFETFKGNVSTDSDSILRDQYEFHWSSTMVYLGSDFITQSKYKGKNGRFRLWCGVRIKLGFEAGNVVSYRLNGWYLGRQISAPGFEPQYEYYFPPIIYTETTAEFSTKKMVSTYLGGLGGFEWAMGKKRSFHLGLQFNLGKSLVFGKKSISVGSGGVLYTLRFLINKPQMVMLPDHSDNNNGIH